MDSVLAPGEQGWGWTRLAPHTLRGHGFTSNLTTLVQGSLQASSSHTVWPMWGTRTERSPQMSAGQPSILGASVSRCERGPGGCAEDRAVGTDPSTIPLPVQVSRSSLMVRVGGGWVALDEYLVKNDPGRGEGCAGREEGLSPRGQTEGRPRALPWGAWHLLCPCASGISGQQREGPARRSMRGSCPGPWSPAGRPPRSHPPSSEPPVISCPGRWVLGWAFEGLWGPLGGQVSALRWSCQTLGVRPGPLFQTGHRNPSSSRSRLRRGTGKGTPQDSLAQPTQD